MTEQSERTIEQAVAHARKNQDTFLEGFEELLRIPSISADPAYTGDVQRAADWLVGEMARIGFKNCQAMPTSGHPIAYGEWLEAGSGKPTLLVYAHFDVQPVDPLDQWVSPPFEPTVREGKLFARGVIDNKCGAYINLKALESFLETGGRLPVNVKLFFEGEEESGSPSMGAFIAQHRELLAADLFILSDGGSLPGQPICLTSTRGIVDGEVTVSGPQRDLHSGTYGGFVHNPIHLVAQIIAACHDEQGRIQVTGFYDDVLPAGPEVLERLNAMEPVLLPEYEYKAGVNAFWGVPDYEILERGTVQPTLDVNGIFGGYQGTGGMTIIPASAGFKVSARLVADQDPDDISRKFEEFVRSFACPTLDIEIRMDPGSWAAELLNEGPEMDVLQRAYRATWGQEALLYREGGSVPVLGMLHRALGMPMIQVAYGVGDLGHAPNEHMLLEYFPRGIELAIHFYQYLGEMSG